MSDYLSADKKSVVLSISFPEEQYRSLLQQLGIKMKDHHDFNFQERDAIFLAAYNWFLAGNLSLDDLSEISNRIKHNFPPEIKKTKHQDDFEIMIYEMASLGIYVRDDGASLGIMVEFMKRAREYYEKYYFFSPKKLLIG